MSIVLDNVTDLIFESTIELDDKFISSYLSEGAIKKALKYGAVGAAAGAAGVKASEKLGGAGLGGNLTGKVAEVGTRAAKAVSDSVSKDGAAIGTHGTVDAIKDVGSELATNTAVHIVGAAAIGAAALGSYANSIFRAKYLVGHYTKLVQAAKDPAAKQKAQNKLNLAKEKLAKAQAKARTEHASFIAKSKKMKEMAAQYAKSGNKAAAEKLNAKLQKRQAFLSKIGAQI